MHLASAEQMHVQMEDRLAPVQTSVDDSSIAAAEILLGGEFFCDVLMVKAFVG